MEQYGESIEQLRKTYGRDVLILGHHYQRSPVIRHADLRGDSLELARRAAHSDAARIVFCGVHFMAESADILSAAGQTVYLPELNAGCPMADMASAEALEHAFSVLGAAANDWLPVVYVNSSAGVKAFCGRHGGSACTSSNAARVFEWVMKQGKRVFFIPDEHLGWNTASDLGIHDSEVCVYDPQQDMGGVAERDLATARVVVWRGFCIVHKAFTVDQVERIRLAMPDARIIVHPEAPKEVVRLCDAHGSTAQIIHYVNAAPAGSTVIVGTELNLVQRLAEEHAGRLTVKALVPSVCANMARITEENLFDTLSAWPSRNEIHVPEPLAGEARECLERMLQI